MGTSKWSLWWSLATNPQQFNKDTCTTDGGGMCMDMSIVAVKNLKGLFNQPEQKVKPENNPLSDQGRCSEYIRNGEVTYVLVNGHVFVVIRKRRGRNGDEDIIIDLTWRQMVE